MVRLFVFLVKLDIHKLKTAAGIYHAAMKDFNIHAEPCPGCGAKGHLSWHDEYSHHLADYYDGKLQEGSVAIRMVSCSSCRQTHTHAVLPDLFIPYKSYSILFIMLVLRASILRTDSVASLCARYGISTSTFYSWKKRYCTHKSLHLDKIEKYLFEKDPHLTGKTPIYATSFLYDFFRRFCFSFLQYSAYPKTTGSGSP